MGKYFGTDGVRGIANQELTAELAYKLGRIGGFLLAKEKNKEANIIIGKDTRISGDMLENALIAGILSVGVNVIKLGVITTPGVAYLTRVLKAEAGIMISASHNPVEDNGIKFFAADGFKISDQKEDEIESLLAIEDQLPRPAGKDIGRIIDRPDAKKLYTSFLKETVNNNFNGLKIVIDTANGAAYEIAPSLFKEMGAEVIPIYNQPDGTNINENCGSTNPKGIVKAVQNYKADIGLAYDGDADRLIAVDEKGQIIDGDHIMLICGLNLYKKGLLKDNTVVTTVMSNFGLYKALEQNGLKSVKTKVGDKYVKEEMLNNGLNLGGEQSGHIIFLDYNTTGDGILTSIQLVNVMKEEKLPLSQLAAIMKKYPQILKNVRVKDRDKYYNNTAIKNAIEKAEEKLGNEGRVLVRPSGTEPLIRVMVEAADEKLLKESVNMLVDVVKKELT